MQYSPVHKAIFSLLCLAFISGSLVQDHFQLTSQLIQFLFICSVIFLVLLQLLMASKYSVSNHLHLLAIVLLGFSAGAYRMDMRHQVPDYHDLESTSYKASIQTLPLETTNSYRLNLILDSVLVGGQYHSSDIKVLAYFEKTVLTSQLKGGDVIRFEGKLQPISGAQNPEGFDYSTYLSHQNIFTSCYIPQDKWESCYEQNPSLRTRAANIQHLVVCKLSALPFKENELAVLSALTVGYKDMIDLDQLQSYAASGATHVLAVSGLHVGILFVFLSRLLRFFGRKSWAIWLRTFLIIILLWCFALISGLSPSVCRATLMFSFINIGIARQRKNCIFNMVFLSALVLLYVNPLNIYALGFQLSYAAVLGILTFEPMFEYILYDKWHIYKPVAELISVSLAAQLATAPICIHTFNTFPVYFILTNIWIIPLVTVILNGAIMLIIMCFVSIPCVFFARLLNILLVVMNKGVGMISNLPYSQLDNLYFSNSQVLVLLLFLALVSMSIIYHNKRFLYLSLLCFVLVPTISFFDAYQQKGNTQFYAFHSYDGFNLCIQEGNKAILYTDSALLLPDYLVHHRLTGDFICQKPLAAIWDDDLDGDKLPFFLVGSQRMAVYNNDMEKLTSPVTINTLFVNEDYPLDLYRLYDKVRFSELVIYKQAMNHYYYRQFCQQKNIRLHVILNDGAYFTSCSSSEKSLALASSN